MIGVDISEPEYAAVGNGKVTAGRVFYGQLAVATDSQFFNFFLNVSHACPSIHVTRDRRDEAARRRHHKYTSKVVVIHHVIAVDRGVHFG